MNIKQFENTLTHFICQFIMVKILKKNCHLILIFSLNIIAERSPFLNSYTGTCTYNR